MVVVRCFITYLSRYYSYLFFRYKLSNIVLHWYIFVAHSPVLPPTQWPWQPESLKRVQDNTHCRQDSLNRSALRNSARGRGVLELCLFNNLLLGISSRFAKMIKLKFAWLFGVKLSFDPDPISCSSVIDKNNKRKEWNS